MKGILLLFIVMMISVSSGMGQVSDSIYNASGYIKVPNNPDSVKFSKDYYFNEGVYLSYRDFRSGNAVPRAYILSKVEKNQLEFYNKLFDDSDTLVIRFGNGIRLIPVDCVFCYVQNNVVYLNVEGTFCRLPVFGSVSHFIGTITVEAFKASGAFYDPYQANGGSSITGGGAPLKAKETRQFLFDFYTGKISLANEENVDEILRRDTELYREYSVLKKRMKRKKMSLFLKKYNEKHPAYFPRF